MPIAVVNPLDGDDLHASSITTNVTDKIVAWAGSHETGATTNGAARHAASQIDDAALPESTVYAAAMDQHGRNDTFATSLSSLAGGGATGYAARIAALAALPYRTIQLINTELATNATAAASAGQLVRRSAIDGSANFAGTANFVGIAATGTIVATGNITGQNIDANGVVIAGSGNIQITTTAGNLDATKLAGLTPAASMPAFTGDVTSIAAGVATTVALVGGVAAANVALGANAANAAVSNGTGNGGKIAKYDVNGGMTYGGPVTGTTFTATTFSGTATAVPASGITGQITGSQADATIAKAANVPTNAGVGATGVWGIGISGTAAVASTVAAGGVGTAAIADGAVTGTKVAASTITGANIALATISGQNMIEGYVAAEGGTLRVFVNHLYRWNGARAGVYWSGGYVDLSSAVAGLAAGQHIYVLIEVNSTPVALGKSGNPVGGALADTDRPTKDPDTTGCAFVALSYGQTAIAQTDITQFRGTDSAEGAAGGGASMVGHVQGQSGESRVGAIGLDEGFPHPTATPSLSFLIEPMHYKTTAGIPGMVGQTLVGPIANPASGLRITPIYFDPATVSYVQGTVSDDPSVPARPAFTGNQIGICYIHTRSGATVVKAGDDGTNAWIEDVRTWTRGGSGVSSIPVAVSEGGTGVPTFAQGLVWQANAGAPTTPLATIPASNSVTVGLAIKPVPSGMSAAATVYDIELGGGTIANGTTALARIVGTHAVAPIKSGGGAATDAVSLLAEAPANGTNNAAGVFAGRVRVGGTTMPTNPLSVTGNVDIAGTLTFATPAAAIGQEAWTAPTLINSWTNNLLNYQPLQYYKDANGIVHLRGGVVGGASGAIICVLPAAYRPLKNEGLIATYYNATTFSAVGGFVDTSGNVAIYQAATAGQMVFIRADWDTR